jgi:hypothetical protein
MSILNPFVAFAVALAVVGTPTAALTQVRAPSDARVEVVFVQPERFRDVADRYAGGGRSQGAYLKEFESYTRSRAERFVAQGQRLVVSITDIDRAGAFEPWRRGLETPRIVRDVYPPRIDLVFTLTAADGTLLKQGERKLRDLALIGSRKAHDIDPLRYEKALIDDWLDRELTRAAGADT